MREREHFDEKIDELIALGEIPGQKTKLGKWVSRQRQNYKKSGKLDKYRIDRLNELSFWYWVDVDADVSWMKNYNILKALNKTPLNSYITDNGIKIGNWCDKQRQNKKQNKLSQDKIHMLEDIPGWFWDKSEKKKNMSKPEIKPKTKKETNKEKQPRVLSEISELHKKYKVKTSHNLHKYFKENPTKWEEYHKISKDNEESFPEHEIPRNKMIKYLENLPGNKQKIVVDLGCGFAEINHHFKDSKRFVFHNFDHHSGNKLVIARDIKNTELEDYSVDIAILSLAMWGSNCNDYLNEVQRILDVGGTLLIAEGFNRWNKELDKNGNPINKLVELLKEHNFTVVKNEEGKFMFIECRKCNIG